MQAQIGNVLGVAARDVGTKMAEITALGTNTVTVSTADVRKFRIGMTIDLVTEADGTVIASARTVDGITAAGVITYSGADAESGLTAGDDSVYSSGDWQADAPALDPKVNLNGGPGDFAGLVINAALTVEDMKARLTAISATTYSAAELNKMTYNDLVYALRVNDASGGI